MPYLNGHSLDVNRWRNIEIIDENKRSCVFCKQMETNMETITTSEKYYNIYLKLIYLMA